LNQAAMQIEIEEVASRQGVVVSSKVEIGVRYRDCGPTVPIRVANIPSGADKLGEYQHSRMPTEVAQEQVLAATR
jgi:hypothetical protein